MAAQSPLQGATTRVAPTGNGMLRQQDSSARLRCARNDKLAGEQGWVPASARTRDGDGTGGSRTAPTGTGGLKEGWVRASAGTTEVGAGITGECGNDVLRDGNGCVIALLRATTRVAPTGDGLIRQQDSSAPLRCARNDKLAGVRGWVPAHVFTRAGASREKWREGWVPASARTREGKGSAGGGWVAVM